MRQCLKTLLLPCGPVVEALGPTDAIRIFQRQSPALILANASLQSAHDGLALAQHIRKRHNITPLILLTANGSEELAIAALRAGVSDYVKLPVAPEELLLRVQDQLSISRRPSASVSDETTAKGRAAGAYMVGNSPSMQQIKAYIEKVGTTDSNVLITGETGTGKELVAELIQQTPHIDRSRLSASTVRRSRTHYWRASCLDTKRERSRGPGRRVKAS